MIETSRLTSGVSYLDRLLGGLFIGDNVIWHDDSGSLAMTFCLQFLRASLLEQAPLVYVSFDRSPKNLLDKLGSFAESQHLIILDGFTCGKGASSPIFMKFYEEPEPERPCEIILIEKPREPGYVTETLYNLLENMQGTVRLIFESLTGMQEIWNGEEALLKFYSHSCPRLYELDTIAYWIMEKLAHSARLRAQINQIAQVAIDLSIKRGTTFLTVLKAEKRSFDELQKPHKYWTGDPGISFDSEKRARGQIDLGLRLKQLRSKRGLSQSELARLIGVTPSTISQVESNHIYPSLPALFKMAEVLFVEVSALFQGFGESERRFIFPGAEAVDVSFSDLPEGTVLAKLLTPVDFDRKGEPYLLEIPPHKRVPSHFFTHKGEEVGYVLSGKLLVQIEKATYTIRSGDVIYLDAEMPTEWKNLGSTAARLLWIKIK